MTLPTLSNLGLAEWPLWVRATMFGAAALWVVAYGWLANFPPRPAPAGLQITAFRQVHPTAGNTVAPGLFLQFTVLNNRADVVAIQDVSLDFFAGTKPTSGLMSGPRRPIDIVVARNDAGRVVASGDGSFGAPVRLDLTQPFAGAPLMVLGVPLDIRVEPRKSETVTIQLLDPSLLDPRVEQVEAAFRFSDGAVSVHVGPVEVPRPAAQ